MEKKTIVEWMAKYNVRPAIHDETLYHDMTPYTYEEFLEKVPYNTHVPLFNDNNDSDNIELVKVENGQVVVAQEIVNQIVNFKKEMLKMELLEKQLKEEIKQAMETNGVQSLEFGELKIKYRSASTRTSIDSTRLKKELPDIYEEYSKTSEVASSISISVE